MIQRFNPTIFTDLNSNIKLGMREETNGKWVDYYEHKSLYYLIENHLKQCKTKCRCGIRKILKERKP